MVGLIKGILVLSRDQEDKGPRGQSTSSYLPSYLLWLNRSAFSAENMFELAAFTHHVLS